MFQELGPQVYCIFPFKKLYIFIMCNLMTVKKSLTRNWLFVKVKMWITINEPYDVAWYGYGTGSQAPGIKEPGTKPYAVGRNLILAHVRVFKLYKRSYAPSQGGKIGIALNSDCKIPKTNSLEDRQAADRAKQFMLGWFASPIFGNGDYPEVMKTRAGSRLQRFTSQEINDNRGMSPFLIES